LAERRVYVNGTIDVRIEPGATNYIDETSQYVLSKHICEETAKRIPNLLSGKTLVSILKVN